MKSRNKEITRGDIYLCDLPTFMYSQVQGGIRPVIIFQNDAGNKHSPTTIVIPLTTRKKKELPTHFTFVNPKNEKVCIALTEQIRVIDKKNLLGKVATLPESLMKDLEKAVKISLNIS